MKPSLVLSISIPISILACHADRDAASPAAPAPKAAATCPTQVNGDRPGYHSGAGPWIRDCNTPWKREYFRVFTQTKGNTTTAYLLPRPDGTPAIATVCDRDDLRPTLDRYGWCRDAVEPDRVNNMTVADALVIAHALHERMKFVGGDAGVWPFPMPDDVAIVCKSPARVPAIAEACTAYEAHAGPAMIPSAASAIAMASALNQLYGIP